MEALARPQLREKVTITCRVRLADSVGTKPIEVVPTRLAVCGLYA